MDRTRTSSVAGVATRVAMLALLALSAAPGSAAELDILNDKGADRASRVLDGAKREGEVVLYSTIIVNQAMRPLAEAFQKKYPFVKMTYWRADPEDIILKLTAEARANNYVADLLEGPDVGELAAEANLALPYSTPFLDQYPAQYRDPRGVWTPTRLSYSSLAYNTKLVAAADVPKTYEALLDPRWKGKMAWRIGSSSGTSLFITNLRTAWGEDRAMSYFKKLSSQQIINFAAGSARTLVDRIMAGEYAIALNIFAHHPLISAAKGAPVNTQLLDPTPTAPSTMVVPKGVRHPHAAMLLADFILSKDGQEVLAKAQYFAAHPDVAPDPEIRLAVPRIAGVPENFLSPEQVRKYSESSEKIYQDLFR
jgi:ABC-type Fe3+ transport system substrate-binding protein